ncbi:hypothetical protein DOTSEDRAFT_32728 [Dothistroma septosporum NZE10]|uniref:Uncharacterized protein n=1 Tax=Dothistroma septosporum (strain NZE10 / CBS 128990) TaxID=675120 RepID=N1PUF7_DOTSN|nr:hypothetical protein DOTSEDRAFT_32728 [Dothistroma septosporum NZE10]
MHLPFTAILAATVTSILALPTIVDDATFFNTTIADKGHHKHPVVARLQLRERDNDGKCTGFNAFKRGKAVQVHANKCVILDDKVDELAEDFTYVPDKKLEEFRHNDRLDLEYKTCEIKAFESEDCGSGEIAASREYNICKLCRRVGEQTDDVIDVSKGNFWEGASSSERTGYQVQLEGWHLLCIPAPKARSVMFECDLPWA